MSRSDPMERRRQAKQNPNTAGQDTLVGAIQGITEGTFELFAGRLTQARHELVHDLTQRGQHAGFMAASAVVMLFGYLLLNVAIVLLTGALWQGALGSGLAALGLALINLVTGGLILRSKMNSFRGGNTVLEKTREELKKDQAWMQETNTRPRLASPPSKET